MKYLSVLMAYLRIGYQVYGSNYFYTKRLFRELMSNLDLDDQTISKRIKKRIFYYTAQCYIVASWTSTLRGKKLSPDEKKSVIALGALTPLIDDLTDNRKMTSAEIFDTLEKEHEEVSDLFLVANYLYKQLLKKHGNSFLDQFQLVMQAQDASLRQHEKEPLKQDELKKITIDKGAMSMLLYRGILSNPIQSQEKEAFMALGYATQLTNDQFDIYKDFQNGVQSSYTQTRNLEANYQEYRRVIQEVISQFQKLEYSSKNIQKSLLQISTILGRGMVCIQQLMDLEKSSGGVFELESYSRKQLICDMEKPENLFRSIQHSLSIFNSILNKQT